MSGQAKAIAWDQIRLLALDVDGVLTDGTIVYFDSGGEGKAFNVADGYGLKSIRQDGVQVAIISARKSLATNRRANELQIRHYYDGVQDKAVCLAKLAKSLKIDLHLCAYMGDDELDLPALQLCGTALAPSNACLAVRQVAHFCTENSGGHGAVREVCDYISTALRART